MVNVDASLIRVVAYVEGRGGMIIGSVDGMNRQPPIRRRYCIGRDPATVLDELSLEVEASEDFIALRIVAHNFIFPVCKSFQHRSSKR
jgi:hypothetical protein